MSPHQPSKTAALNADPFGVRLEEETSPFDTADYAAKAFTYTVPDHPVTHLHLHQFLECGYCLRGSGLFFVGNKIREFRAGCAFIVSQYEPHLAQSTFGDESTWVFLYVDIGRMLAPLGVAPQLLDASPLCGPAFPNVFFPQSHPQVCRSINELTSAALEPTPLKKIRVQGLLLNMMALLHEMKELHSTVHHGDYTAFKRLEPALNTIGTTFRSTLSVSQLAHDCCLSPSRFRLLFHAYTGRTPLEYLHEVRILHACNRLRDTTHPVGHIAQECGFGSVSAFNRAFLKKTGVSPLQWRKARCGTK